MTDESLVLLLALFIIATSLAAMAVALFNAIPFAIRRIREYPSTEDPRRVFAVWQLCFLLLATLCLCTFLTVGVVVIAIPETTNHFRQIVTRFALLLGILATSLKVILMPVAQRQIEDAAEAELEKVSDRLDHAATEAEDRYAEKELEKTEVRSELSAAKKEEREYAGGVAKEVNAKLDYVIDLLERRDDK